MRCWRGWAPAVSPLTALVALSEVLRISVDRLDTPHLANSTRVIGSDNVRDAIGNPGAGTAIAILDTGVDSSHPFLAGKVVSEACFCGPHLSAGNFCPGGSNSVAAGCGVPCAINLCDHGTHVAGTAAGRRFNNAAGSVGFDGVAIEADIIAIPVFRRRDGAVCSFLMLPSPYALSNASD